MPLRPKTLALLAFQAVICAGALIVVAGYPDPAQFKIPVMLLGFLGLLPLMALRLRAGTHLLPGLLLICYLYVRVLPSPNQHAAALTLLACAAAFLFGIARVPLAGARLMLPLALVCVARSAMDLFTLDHLGGNAPPGHAVTAFFLDKHVAGGVMILAAFLHFHFLEKRGSQRPVPAHLYTSGFAVLMAIVLGDSRVVQGAFLACFLPLLFLAIRLDGKDPVPERLAWIAGITLCLGLAFVNLPEWQLRRVAESFAPATPGRLQVAWAATLDAARDAPLFGNGMGTLRWATAPHLGPWTDPASGGSTPVLDHAGSHLLEVLSAGGAVGAALELFLLLIALAGMAIVYFREWTLQAKYGFFALAALALLGLVTPALDKAPLNVAYWCLIGYGWSFAAQAFPRWLMPYRREAGGEEGGRLRRRDLAAGAMTAAAVACLIIWHLFHRAKEFQAQRLLHQAWELAESDPPKSADRLTEALAWDPRNEEANYGYIRLLGFFRREAEARKRLEYIQDLAPDWRREAQALAELYQVLGDHDGAASQAARLLSAYPLQLEAMEMRARALQAAGRCEALDSLHRDAARLAGVYAMPRSRDYTIQSLDSLFMANRDIGFLQRWFAGPSLRQRFVERQLLEYNREFQYYSRARTLLEARCRMPEEMHPDGDGKYHPWDAPTGLSPDGDPDPGAWIRAKPKPAAPPPKRRRKFRHRNLAGLPVLPLPAESPASNAA